MKLKQHEELIGFLKDIKKENGEKIILIFEMQKVIEIPSNSDVEENLKKYIGKNVGIFLFENSYLFRLIGDDKNAEDKK